MMNSSMTWDEVIDTSSHITFEIGRPGRLVNMLAIRHAPPFCDLHTLENNFLVPVPSKIAITLDSGLHVIFIILLF